MVLVTQKMSNSDYYYLAGELQPLVGGFVNKIYELRPNLFRFKIRADKDYNFIAEVGLRAHLSKYIEESPETPTNFAMLLRKYLENAKITGIKQENEDRLLIFTLQKKEEYHLIFEMFAKGNLILTTADYTIIAPYKNEKGKTRVILRKETYAALPNQNRLSEKPPKSPTAYYDNGKIAAFSSIPSSKYGKLQSRTFPSVSEMADEYYYSVLQQAPEQSEPAEQPADSEMIKKLEHTLKQQQLALKKFSEEAEKHQAAGNYVYENFEQIENCIKTARKMKKDGKSISDICKELETQYNLKIRIEKENMFFETTG